MNETSTQEPDAGLVRLVTDAASMRQQLRFAFANHYTVVQELIQNARRAGASRVRIDHDESTGTLVVDDDGAGIEDFQTLLTFAASGWSTELAESAEARAWAIAVAAELRALDGAQRGAPAPERPAPAPDESASPAEPDAAAETAAEGGELASGTVPAAVRGPARPAPRLGEDYAWPADGERERAARPSSRLGGWLLLGGLGLIVAVAAIWGITQLSSDDGNTTTSGAGTTTQATTPTTTTPSTTSSGDASGDQVVLRPADSASAAAGLAQVFRTDGKLSLGVVGEGLEPSPRYVIWLYNSRSDARFRGFAPKGGVGKNGRLRALVQNLGTNPGRYRSIVVTLEQTSQEPARPGKIVLRGPLKLPS